MKAYAITMLALLGTALNGCNGREIAVRPAPLPPSMQMEDLTALAKGRLMFKNAEYALAADAFRKALRQNPDSVDAYNGLAAAYDELGRFDLSRRYYELGLARAPEDTRILRNMARSMMRQGFPLAARRLVAEARHVDASRLSVAMPKTEVPQILRAGANEIGKPVILPQLALHSDLVDIEMDRVSFTNPPQKQTITTRYVHAEQAPASVLKPTVLVSNRDQPSILLAHLDATARPLVPTKFASAKQAPVSEPPALQSSIMHLEPEPAESQPNIVTPIASVDRGAPSLLQREENTAAAVAPPEAAAPAKSPQLAMVDDINTLDTTSVSFMSYRSAKPARPGLYVINGVGRHRQAARMRTYLRSEGWQYVSTGNARQRVVRSRVYYASGNADEARKLAATLPFAPRLLQAKWATKIVLVLGREATTFDRSLLVAPRNRA